MINSSSDDRVKRAIASEVVDFGKMPSPVKPKTQKLVFTAFYLTLSTKRTVMVMMEMTILKPKTLEKFQQVLVSILTFQEKTV